MNDKIKQNKNVMILHDQKIKENGILIINLLKSFLFEKLFIFEEGIHAYVNLMLSSNLQKNLNEIVSIEQMKIVNN